MTARERLLLALDDLIRDDHWEFVSEEELTPRLERFIDSLVTCGILPTEGFQ